MKRNIMKNETKVYENRESQQTRINTFDRVIWLSDQMNKF